MKRIKQLWPKIITFRNLLLAFKKVRKGKRPDGPGFAGWFVEQQASEASFRQTQQERTR